MPGIGHFPFAENPALFAEYLLPVLKETRNCPGKLRSTHA
jgi:pimeloyl-ACP methyl ester carboxylesterase